MAPQRSLVPPTPPSPISISPQHWRHRRRAQIGVGVVEAWTQELPSSPLPHALRAFEASSPKYNSHKMSADGIDVIDPWNRSQAGI